MPPATRATPPAVGMGFCLLASLYAGSLVLAAPLAAKIISVGPLDAPAGVLAFSLTFLCTDIVTEIWGRRQAFYLVGAGFVTLLVALGLVQLALIWPAAGFWDSSGAFAEILAQSQRVIVASVLAYLASQLLDVWLFARLRAATDGRFLWLRNNASTALAQLLDSVVFVSVAFAGTGTPLAVVIFGQWVIKLGIAVVDTPVVYAGVWGLRRLGRVGPQPAGG